MDAEVRLCHVGISTSEAIYGISIHHLHEANLAAASPIRRNRPSSRLSRQDQDKYSHIYISTYIQSASIHAASPLQPPPAAAIASSSRPSSQPAGAASTSIHLQPSLPLCLPSVSHQTCTAASPTGVRIRAHPWRQRIPTRRLGLAARAAVASAFRDSLAAESR